MHLHAPGKCRAVLPSRCCSQSIAKTGYRMSFSYLVWYQTVASSADFPLPTKTIEQGLTGVVPRSPVQLIKDLLTYPLPPHVHTCCCCCCCCWWCYVIVVIFSCDQSFSYSGGTISLSFAAEVWLLPTWWVWAGFGTLPDVAAEPPPHPRCCALPEVRGALQTLKSHYYCCTVLLGLPILTDKLFIRISIFVRMGRKLWLYYIVTNAFVRVN